MSREAIRSDIDSHSYEIKTPTVTRDKRGRILWKLPGNTQEQNEQFAVSNMRALLLEKIPRLEDYLAVVEDRIVVLPEHKRKVCELILEQCGDKANCIHLFGEGPRKAFGSHFVALQRATDVWELKLNFGKQRAIRRPQIWKNKAQDQTNELIRNLFFKRYPEAKELLDEMYMDALKDFILGQIGTSVLFGQMFPSVRPDRMPYVSPVHRSVIEGAFSPLGIIFSDENFRNARAIRRDKPIRYWLNAENIEEAALAFYQANGQLTKHALENRKQFALENAIKKHYPGGIKALKEKLGIKKMDKEPEISSQIADEQLRRILEAQ